MKPSICDRCEKEKKKHIRTKLPFNLGDEWVLCCPGQDDNSYDEYKARYPRKIISIHIEVIETEEGKHTVHYSTEENDSTMKTTGLLLYKMKQIEQELIDRIWDNGGEGYEITGENPPED